ncbi:hypothetical protein [Amycolatopsis sp. A1MSW2902]|uniref:hypothetical protein n=1 Tax=Amycolatopsis sp. A1MSW2902 TaxID=687413 RepID=UPI00307D1682
MTTELIHCGVVRSAGLIRQEEGSFLPLRMIAQVEVLFGKRVPASVDLARTPFLSGSCLLESLPEADQKQRVGRTQETAARAGRHDMPDGTNSGLQGVQNQIISTAPTAPPPGSGFIPGANAAAPPPPPPDYEALGKKQASADFAAASGNQGWEFDPAAIDEVIKSLEDSLDGDHERASKQARLLTQIVPPGSEVGSQGYADVANKPGIAYNNFLTGAVSYITAYVDTLKQIRTAYQNNDQNAKDQLRAAGKVD